MKIDDLIPNSTLPEGEIGDARLVRFEVTPDGAAMANMRLMISGQAHRGIVPGTYTKLIADGRLQMSDTPAEKADHAEVVRAATGDCLVMGLGLGMVAIAMAQKPEVRSVTVIEKNPNVIRLVAPHMPEKVTVIEADALEWKPPAGRKWDVIWHDIWPTICTDDCADRTKLARRYARRWTVMQGAWASDEIRDAKARERSY